MNIKALITTLVLGSSSVAMARPAAAAPVTAHVEASAHVEIQGPTLRYRQPGTIPAPVYRPTRVYQPSYQPSYERPWYRPAWVSLGGVNQIADGEMSFRVGRFAKEFSTLKLQSSAGKSLIYRVLIQFANGRTQVVELNQYLNASNPSITIDLNGRSRQVAKVTVVGRNARQSAFQVLAI